MLANRIAGNTRHLAYLNMGMLSSFGEFNGQMQPFSLTEHFLVLPQH